MTETPATAGFALRDPRQVAALGESRRMEQTGQRGEGAKVAAAFRGFFLLVGISAIAVVVFLIVSSAI
jgi:hypothetical protein